LYLPSIFIGTPRTLKAEGQEGGHMRYLYFRPQKERIRGRDFKLEGNNALLAPPQNV